MQAAKLIESHTPQWRKLEKMCLQLEGRSDRKKLSARQRVEFAAMYRGVCADLAMSDAYQLPPETTQHLNQLVGRAHNQLYRTHNVKTKSWNELIFKTAPRLLYRDGAVRLAAAIFWLPFLASMFLSSNYSPVQDYAERVIGEDYMLALEEMHSEPPGSGGQVFGGLGAGGYTKHNTTIGLRCFVWGLVFGVGGLFETINNALILGAAFGHMTTVPHSEYFFEFVTAHGPFELTAIVLSAAAGMKMGFSLINTGGLRRLDSLQKSAHESLPILFTGVVLFLLAALIEGFLSPSAAPYEVKAFVSMMSTLALLAYMVVLGYSQENSGVEDQGSEDAQAAGGPLPSSPWSTSPDA